MPLLARKLDHINVFINSKTPFRYHADPRKADYATSLANLFMPGPDGFKLNCVIKDDDQNTRLKELLTAFEQSKAAGEGLVYSDTYDIRRNKHYGVPAQRGVRITWIYNERIKKWVEALPFQSRHMIQTGEVENFPHYQTFFQTFPRVIDLSATEASCWLICRVGT